MTTEEPNSPTTAPTKPRVLTHNEWLRANPVSCRRGAPLGCGDANIDPGAPVHIERLDFVDGDYDRSGTYWGRSDRAGAVYALWQNLCGERRVAYRRAKSRRQAVADAIEEGFVPIRGNPKGE